jgi:hypothetical protein
MINAIIGTDIHPFPLGQVLYLDRWSNIKSDNNGFGCRREMNNILGDRAVNL